MNNHGRPVKWMLVVVGFVILGGCQGNSDGAQPTGITPVEASPTATWTLTPSPSPTEVPFPVQVVDLGAGHVTLDTSLRDLPSGAYFLYDYYGTADEDVIYYRTQDGLQGGPVLDLAANGLGGGGTDAALRIMDGRPILYLFDRIDRLWQVDLYTGESQSWMVLAPDITCNSLVSWISPDGRWRIGDCAQGQEHYVYVVDLASGTGVALSPRGYECRHPYDGYWSFVWTPEGQLQVTCRGMDTIECEIDPESMGYQCRRGALDQVLGFSPDGEWVVLVLDRDDAKWRLSLTRTSCWQDQQGCEDEMIMEGLYMPGSFVWDETGDRFAWAEYVLWEDSTYFDYYSHLRVLDLGTDEIQTVQEYWHGMLTNLSFSPDGQWLLANGDGGVVLFSLTRPFVRRVPPGGWFLGWFEVP